MLLANATTLIIWEIIMILPYFLAAFEHMNRYFLWRGSLLADLVLTPEVNPITQRC